MGKDFNNVREKEYPMLISNPYIINNIEADFIIISVITERYINEITEFIKQNCKSNKKIILINKDKFSKNKIIQLSDNIIFEKALNDWKDYIYLGNKYSHYVSTRKFTMGKDSGITWILWFQVWDKAPEIVQICRESVEKYGGDCPKTRII